MLNNASMGKSVHEAWNELLDPDFRDVVPPLWLTFEPPSKRIHRILGILYIIIMTGGLLGNLVIIYLFVIAKSLRKPSNYLVLNLAISDVLMLSKMVVFIYNSFAGRPAAGLHWCTYYGAVGGLSGISAIMTIAAMAAERYFSISRPLDPNFRMTRRRAIVTIAAIWVYSTTFSMAPVFGLNRYVPEGFLTSCSFDYLSEDTKSHAFIVVLFVAAWLVPLTIVCRCYIGIFLSVRENQHAFTTHAMRMEATDPNLEKHKKIEVKLAKIAFGLISLWTVSWTPYAVVALLGFTDRSKLTPLMSMIPALFCKTASVLDPFVYCLSNKTFKAELMKRLGCCPMAKIRRQITSFTTRAMSERESSIEDRDDESVDDFEKETRSSGENYGKVAVPDVDGFKVTLQDIMREANVSRNAKQIHVQTFQDQVVQRTKNIKIFVIPQAHSIKSRGDTIRMTFRRSL